MKVQVVDLRSGREKIMTKRYAEILEKMGRVRIGTYQTRDMQAGRDSEVLISDSVREFAEENGIDPESVKGTGKDGRVLKSDIQEAIQAKKEV
ncbi:MULTISPECIES: E3 binding domain-containing protein [Pseudomonas]|uniref:E3 binding domain-containing protein n=1 Tax=Pseudomonas luteola TaxID=47886 RepID=A0ABS0FPJ6_PSELU|nr:MULTISPECIES: E3 binding domain-containing protein [Pseudomonas]MBF8642264.1 E3 binding domain-containing protein [Pseudomonas zeshuii]RRW48351.1 hypothetical protein EGJ50_10350 [Pseudomonas luteola]SHJ24586.1 e3 binding domain-containing protein [Pseudomonas zeshuii]